MQTFETMIVGVTSLLQHRFGEEAEAPGETRRMLVKHGTPREQAEKACYRRTEGNLYMPGAAFGRLIREAGANHKLKGSRKSAKYVVPAAVLVLDDAVDLIDPDTEQKLTTFEVDSRPVVIPATKGRIMRHRPRLDRWAVKMALRVNEKLLPIEFVQQLLTEGGQGIGVGDYRPEKGGPFGTFRVTHWAEVKNVA